jgi:hypothetical protein
MEMPSPIDDSLESAESDVERQARQVEKLLPAFRLTLKDPFNADTRQAQNLTILTAGIGIVLFFGWVQLDKISVVVADLKDSRGVASVLLCVTSIFLLSRFLVFAVRDMTLYALEKAPAYSDIDKAMSPINQAKRNYEGQIDQITSRAIKEWKTMDDPEIKEAFQRAKNDFDATALKYQYIMEVVDKQIFRIQRLDRIRYYIEFVFPILIVVVLLGVNLYQEIIIRIIFTTR